MPLVLPSRPVVDRPQSLGVDYDYEHACELVHTYGWDTLAHFALRRDKQYFFSSDGEAMVAYVRFGRYVLVWGDPIGLPSSIDAVVDEFVAMCRHRRWRCAFLAVREAEVPRYRRLGMKASHLGEEAVIDCERFSLAGEANASVRQSVRRTEGTHRFEMLAESEASATLVAQLDTVARNRRQRGVPTRGFTMTLGQPIGAGDAGHVLAVAFDGRDVPGGFLRLVPSFGRVRGMAIDMIRLAPDAPAGMAEFLIANTVFALRAAGVAELSVTFAAMGRLFNREGGRTLGRRVLKAAVSLGDPFFRIKAAHEFSRRFQPTWRPRMIAYDQALARVALLYGGVEGHLALPLIRPYFVPPRVEHDRDPAPVEPPDPPGSISGVPVGFLGGTDGTDRGAGAREPRRVTADVRLDVGDPPHDRHAPPRPEPARGSARAKPDHGGQPAGGPRA
jgi:lysylphosphatidylglycerol synthetase-like protein (DUF2156 family)